MTHNGQISAIFLRLRTQPDADRNDNIINTLVSGTKVEILNTLTGGDYKTSTGNTRNDWHQVKVNNKQGFVAAAFVTLVRSPRVIPEIRGVWIANHSHSPVLTSKTEIIKALEFLQDKGFNTVFPAVWNRGFTAFPSRVMADRGFPAQDPFYASINFDPLAEIVSQARARNMAVIPWFEYGFAASPRPGGGHILQQQPQWSAIDKVGNKVVHGGLTWMNSLDPEVQEFILDLILEVVVNYDVDGIQGDDRLPALPFKGGYDINTKNQYQAKYGTLTPAQEKDRQWVKFRADILTDFLEQLFNRVKSTKPNVFVSMAPAVFPFSLNNLMQDSHTWVEKNILDFIHPQLYRPSFASYRTEVNKIKTAFPRTTERNKFAPGIAFKANGINLTPAEILKCVKLNRDSDFRGQVFFFYEGLRQNEDEMAIALNL